jgi:hypothetical protein
MGTRNLTVVKDLQGTTKIALYGQWDGYPSYSGIKALEFLRGENNQHKLFSKLSNVEFISDEESDTLYKSTEPYTDHNASRFLELYPALHRDTGTGILEIVANSTGPIKTIDNSEFRNDTLFCEGIYEVDFSTNKFISTYNDTVAEFDLDNLPTNEQYLEQWEVEQIPA